MLSARGGRSGWRCSSPGLRWARTCSRLARHDLRLPDRLPYGERDAEAGRTVASVLGAYPLELFVYE